MQLEEMIMVIENEKGTERNYLMDVLEYLSHINQRTEQTPVELGLCALELTCTKEGREKWMELYIASNKTISARYCYDEEQLCDFLNGVFNDRDASCHFCPEMCSKSCLDKLEEIGIDHGGSYQKEEQEKAYKVEIREILSRIETVNARTLEEAIDMTEEKYRRSEIILGAEDFKGVTIEQKRERGGR